MKKIQRIALLVAALLLGGGLGYLLLPGFGPVQVAVFVVSIVILGQVFARIDKRIAERSQKARPKG